MYLTLQEFALNIGAFSNDQDVVKGYAVDSRKIEKGFIFFALKGEKVDGHDFVEMAFQRGAIAAVVEKSKRNFSEKYRVFPVDDPLRAMQTLAKKRMSTQNKRILAITGSVGKTTTKEYCSILLSEKFSVFKTPGNANSQIGLPLSVLNKEDFKEDVFVLEMGMSGHNQIANLVEIVPPELSIITKIAPAHIEFFSDGLEGIAKAKSEILLHPKTKAAIINLQAESFSAIKNKRNLHKIFYSLDPKVIQDENTYVLEHHENTYRISSKNDMSPWMPAIIGETHLLENFLASAIAARYFGLSWNDIISASSRLQSIEKRFEKIHKNGAIYINDSYNANPESMKAALSNLPKSRGGKIIAALGHMVELGDLSERYHSEVGRFAADYVDVLLCVGKMCIAMKNAFEESGKPSFYFEDISQMKNALGSMVKENDVVLIKASNSVNLWNLLDA